MSERIADERGAEALAKDIEEWLKDPRKFDLPHVDEPASLTFHRVEEPVGDGLIHGDIRARNRSGREVGHIFYTRNPCDIHLSLIGVRPEYRGKGYSVYLLREFINMQDKHCINATLEAVPFGVDEMEELAPELWKKNLEVLKEFYGSFGFEQVAGDLMARRPSCEGRKLKPECEKLDLSMLARVMEDEPG